MARLLFSVAAAAVEVVAESCFPLILKATILNGNHPPLLLINFRRLEHQEQQQHVGCVQSAHGSPVPFELWNDGRVPAPVQGVHRRSIPILESNCQRVSLESGADQRRIFRLQL
jgi:hypothetical protein